MTQPNDDLLEYERDDAVVVYMYSDSEGLDIVNVVTRERYDTFGGDTHTETVQADSALILGDVDLENMRDHAERVQEKKLERKKKKQRAIVGFEDEHTLALEVALRSMWPHQDVQVYDKYNDSMFRRMIERDNVAFVVTDMLMPCAFKSRDAEHVGAAVVAQCTHVKYMCMETHSFVDGAPVPAVCVSSSYHHDNSVNFGNTLLRCMGVEMVDQAEKHMAVHWCDAIEKGMIDGRYNTTGGEITVEQIRAIAEGGDRA